MELNELKELEKLQTDKINTFTKARSDTRQQLADLACPYVVGDRVVDKKGNNAEVTRIAWVCWSEGYEFFIKKIKKDGGLFANESRPWNNDKWSKL